jgi:hypothetical protein
MFANDPDDDAPEVLEAAPAPISSVRHVGIAGAPGNTPVLPLIAGATGPIVAHYKRG